MKKDRPRNLCWCCFLAAAGTLTILEWLGKVNLGGTVFQGIRDSLVSFILSSSEQIYLVGCLVVWFLALWYVGISDRAVRVNQRFWRSVLPEDWCGFLLLSCAIGAYVMGQPSMREPGSTGLLLLGIDQSMNVLVFLMGIVLCQGARLLSRGNGAKIIFLRMTLLFFVIVFAASCLIQINAPHVYQYHNRTRWTGLWVNPNIYGLLMGTGTLLAAGRLVHILKSQFQIHLNEGEEQSVWWWRSAKTLFFLLAAGLMSLGLLKSYSRGAWVATGCGTVYLGIALAKGTMPEVRRWMKIKIVSGAVIILSVGVLSLWQLRTTDKVVVRRAMSVGNANDLSWRNRVSAWDGTLQMMAECPWFGFGWNQSEANYDHFYRVDRITEPMAVEMNDYLMLGSTLGVPALFCFCMYVWLCLTRSTEGAVRKDQISHQGAKVPSRPGSETEMKADADQAPPSPSAKGDSQSISELAELDWLQATCRAGAIVLLVGFWFDGGLFKMATAAPFWILLELGRRDIPHTRDQANQNQQS